MTQGQTVHLPTLAEGPLGARPGAVDAPGFDPGALPAGDVEGLYVHIPFCFHKCHYCDFYSITRQDEGRMGRFVDRMLAEAGRWVEDWRGPLQPRTVFFGGGTPTLLPIAEMR